MANTRKLSSEEVTALLEGLQSGAFEAAKPPKVEYEAYQFGGSNLELLGDLSTLRLINARLGRQMRNVLMPMLRFEPRINAMPPETVTYETYFKKLDSFLSLTTARVDALKGSILITMPARLISILVQSFFGGKGDAQATRQNEFTPTEERIIQIIGDGILKALEDSWKEIYPCEFELINNETNPAFASFVETHDLVVVCTFVLQLPFSKPVSIDIVYPLQSFKQIAPLLRSKIQRTGEGTDEEWERRLREALMAVPISFIPRLAEPTISLPELLRLHKGMVIEIPAFEDVHCYVEGRELFVGTIGEQDTKMAVRIKKTAI
jgi:flagellar motor switch protein FliM